MPMPEPEVLDAVEPELRDAVFQERDDIVLYLRTMADQMQLEASRLRWWQAHRIAILGAAAFALGMAADGVALRHRRQDV